MSSLGVGSAVLGCCWQQRDMYVQRIPCGRIPGCTSTSGETRAGSLGASGAQSYRRIPGAHKIPEAPGAPSWGNCRVEQHYAACAFPPQSKQISALKMRHNFLPPVAAVTILGTCGMTRGMDFYLLWLCAIIKIAVMAKRQHLFVARALSPWLINLVQRSSSPRAGQCSFIIIPAASKVAKRSDLRINGEERKSLPQANPCLPLFLSQVFLTQCRGQLWKRCNKCWKVQR